MHLAFWCSARCTGTHLAFFLLLYKQKQSRKRSVFKKNYGLYQITLLNSNVSFFLSLSHICVSHSYSRTFSFNFIYSHWFQISKIKKIKKKKEREKKKRGENAATKKRPVEIAEAISKQQSITSWALSAWIKYVNPNYSFYFSQQISAV